MPTLQLSYVEVPTIFSSAFGSSRTVKVVFDPDGVSRAHVVSLWSNGHMTADDELIRLVGFERLRVLVEGFVSSGAGSTILERRTERSLEGGEE